MMRLSLDYADFGTNNMEDAETIVDKLEKKLENEFCQWDIDVAFDWDTLRYFSNHIEIEFAEFK